MNQKKYTFLLSPLFIFLINICFAQQDIPIDTGIVKLIPTDNATLLNDTSISESDHGHQELLLDYFGLCERCQKKNPVLPLKLI